jgi:hypothetical protein
MNYNIIYQLYRIPAIIYKYLAIFNLFHNWVLVTLLFVLEVFYKFNLNSIFTKIFIRSINFEIWFKWL